MAIGDSSLKLHFDVLTKEWESSASMKGICSNRAYWGHRSVFWYVAFFWVWNELIMYKEPRDTMKLLHTFIFQPINIRVIIVVLHKKKTKEIAQINLAELGDVIKTW